MEAVAVPVLADVSQPRAVGVSIDDALAGWKDRLTARCRPASVRKMTRVVEGFALAAGWLRVGDVSLSTSEATLAAKRRGGWSGATHDQAVTCLRVFGDYLRRSGHFHTNPLADLDAIGARGGDGARPLTVEEARELLRVSWDRYRRTAQVSRCAPLFWATMLYTGLRYSEARALRWSQIASDAAGHTLITDPNAEGNKSGDRDEIPLRADLMVLLEDWKRQVSHGPKDPVFPAPPSHKTFQADRKAAQIAQTDPRRGCVCPHSLRKSFITWLDGLNIPRGLVSHLARHSGTLAESAYIQHDPRAARKAVDGLSPVWENLQHICTKSLDGVAIVRQDGSTTQDKAPMTPTATHIPTDRPVAIGASCVVADPCGPGRSVRMSGEEVQAGFRGSPGNRSFQDSLAVADFLEATARLLRTPQAHQSGGAA